MDVSEKNRFFELCKGLLLSTVVISLLGYVDFLTGEVSIDILYILCICLVTWYSNTFTGLLCVIESICAKTAADYYDKVKIGSHLYEWNTINYILIYIVVCLLVGRLKKILSQ